MNSNRNVWNLAAEIPYKMSKFNSFAINSRNLLEKNKKLLFFSVQSPNHSQAEAVRVYYFNLNSKKRRKMCAFYFGCFHSLASWQNIGFISFLLRRFTSSGAIGYLKRLLMFLVPNSMAWIDLRLICRCLGCCHFIDLECRCQCTEIGIQVKCAWKKSNQADNSDRKGSNSTLLSLLSPAFFFPFFLLLHFSIRALLKHLIHSHAHMGNQCNRKYSIGFLYLRPKLREIFLAISGFLIFLLHTSRHVTICSLLGVRNLSSYFYVF